MDTYSTMKQLEQIDSTLAAISVRSDDVFLMSSARQKLKHLYEEVKNSMLVKEESNG